MKPRPHHGAGAPARLAPLLLLLLQAAVLAAIARADTEFTTLRAMPVPRDTWEPRDRVRAGYFSHAEQNNNNATLVIADALYSTSRPTLNLDNFAQIKDLECRGTSEVVLDFDDADAADRARSAWSKAANLAVMFGAHHKCKGASAAAGDDNTHFRAVRSIDADAKKDKRIVLHTDKIDREDVIDEFEMDIGHFENNLADNSTPVGSPEFLGIHRNREEKKAKEDRDNQDPTKWKTKSKTISLNVNYNATSNSAKHKDLWLVLPRFEYSLVCAECYTRGHAKLQIRFRGSWKGLKAYEVLVDAQLKLNMDFEARLSGIYKKDLVEVPLFKFPLTPIAVPGLFTVGPELRLITAIDIKTELATYFNFGFDVDFPFRMHATSVNASSRLRPTIQHHGKPKFNSHKFNVSQETSIRFAAHLQPEIALTVSVVNKKIFDAKIGLDFHAGVRALGLGASTCPNPNDTQINLYRQVDLKFAISLPSGWWWAYKFWSTGMYPWPVCPRGGCFRCLSELLGKSNDKPTGPKGGRRRMGIDTASSKGADLDAAPGPAIASSEGDRAPPPELGAFAGEDEPPLEQEV